MSVVYWTRRLDEDSTRTTCLPTSDFRFPTSGVRKREENPGEGKVLEAKRKRRKQWNLDNMEHGTVGYTSLGSWLRELLTIYWNG